MLFVTIIFIVIVYIVIKWFSGSRSSDMDKMPRPKGYPIVGNSLDLLKDRVGIMKQKSKWNQQFDGFFSLNIFNVYKTLEISRPEDIEAVISSPVHNKKAVYYGFLESWLQDGLLLSDGQKWQNRRRILTPAFHFNILRRFTTILEENSQNLVKILEAEACKPKTNIIPLISGYTLNSICETAMGIKVDDNEKSGIKYKNAIYELGSLVIIRITNVLFISPFIYHLSSYGRKQKKVMKVIRDFPKKVINERRKFVEKNGAYLFNEESDSVDSIYMKNKKRMAMLDLLLNAEKENLIDEEGIQEEVDTFMFEGHDTTAAALNFAIMSLANYKDIQEKVVAELRGVFGDSDRIATIEDLNQLKYLECCIKETLRLYPSVHMIGRQIGQDITLNNYTIPAGTICSIHIFDTHRRSEIYPNPLVFDPDRFLPENCAGRHPYAYLPFSAGPRNCIGQKFAILEMKSAIAAILRRFELRPITKPSEIEFYADLILRPTHPIYVNFVSRNN